MYGAPATALQLGGVPGSEENMGEEQSRKMQHFVAPEP